MADANGIQQAQLEEITEPVKAFILETFLPGEDPSALEMDTPLISGGVEGQFVELSKNTSGYRQRLPVRARLRYRGGCRKGHEIPCF